MVSVLHGSDWCKGRGISVINVVTLKLYFMSSQVQHGQHRNLDYVVDKIFL